jgi:hypothetical protein
VFNFLSCCSSAVEHFLGKEEVGSSILLNSSESAEGRKRLAVLPIAIGTAQQKCERKEGERVKD